MLRPNAKSTFACLRCQIRERSKVVKKETLVDGISFRSALRLSLEEESEIPRLVPLNRPDKDPFGRPLKRSSKDILPQNKPIQNNRLNNNISNNISKSGTCSIGGFRKSLAQTVDQTTAETWNLEPDPDVGEINEQSAISEIQVGDLVEIRRGGGKEELAIRIPFTGVTDKNVNAYLSSRARTIFCHDSAIAFRIPGFISEGIAERLSTDDMIQPSHPLLSHAIHPLRKFDAEAKALASTKLVSVQSIHNGLTSKKITTLKVAETLFGKSPSLQQIYATHLLMMQDQKRFIADPKTFRQSMTFDVRPSERITNMEKVTTWIREMTSEVASFISKANRIIIDQKPEEWTKQDIDIIEYLKAYVLERKQLQTSLYQSFVPAILRKINGYHSRALDRGTTFQFLKDVGIFSSHENHVLQDPSINLYPFKGEIESLQDGISKRETITRQVYAIDALDAKELDDAVSYENINGQEWLHVHIANPTAYLHQKSLITLDAKNRASTLYLPEITVPMLPDKIVTRLLSLQNGSPVLTLSARVNDSGDLIDYKLSHGILTKVKKLTYDQVDHVLAGLNPAPRYEWFVGAEKPPQSLFEPAVLETCEIETLLGIQRIAQRILQRRVSNGCFTFEFPDFKVNVSPNPLYPTMPNSTLSTFSRQEPDIMLSVAHENDISRPARLLVSELMILGGQVVARYCSQHNIPISYRIQTFLRKGESTTGYNKLLNERDSVGFVPINSVLQFVKYLKPTSLSVISGHHQQLAVDGYTKATSPLRRFGDMVVHYQLDAHISGLRPPFTVEEIQQDMNPIAWRENAASHLSKLSSKHWVCQLLNRLPEMRDIEFEGMIKMTGTEACLCLAKELGIQVEIKGVPPNERLLGRRLRFRIEELDLYQLQVYGTFCSFM